MDAAAHLDIHVANLEVPFRVNITVGGLDLFNPHAAAKEEMVHNWSMGSDHSTSLLNSSPA